MLSCGRRCKISLLPAVGDYGRHNPRVGAPAPFF
jgi:hypothetical protein